MKKLVAVVISSVGIIVGAILTLDIVADTMFAVDVEVIIISLDTPIVILSLDVVIEIPSRDVIYIIE